MRKILLVLEIEWNLPRLTNPWNSNRLCPAPVKRKKHYLNLRSYMREQKKTVSLDHLGYLTFKKPLFSHMGFDLGFFNSDESKKKSNKLFCINIQTCVGRNGHLSAFFRNYRVCLQGDPISSYLFLFMYNFIYCIPETKQKFSKLYHRIACTKWHVLLVRQYFTAA